MISTQLLAMASGLVLGTTTAPNWQSDYPTALAQATQMHKPMAVLINAGDAGKQLSQRASDALANNYVCVYADVSTAKGRELANSFRLAEGLVISDSNAQVQAVRYAGKVNGETVAALAEQYSTPVAVTQTAYAGSSEPAVIQAAATTPVITQSAPIVVSAPVMNAPVYQSAPMYQMAPTVIRGGGCPNGNCGR